MQQKMGVSPVLSVFLFALLSSVVSGGHDHHKDIPWLDILSHMGWLKNQTEALSTVESVVERTDKIKDSHHFESTSEPQTSEFSTDSTATAIVQKSDHVYYVRPNYSLIISLPIVGLVILIACCVGICKCCCGSNKSQGMVLLQQPNAVHPPPVSTQIIVQQPNYPQGQPTYLPGQPAPPPPYQMQQPVQNYDPQSQQWSHQPPTQQWEAHQTQDPQYPKQGYDNPSFNPTAPPPYPQGKY